MLGEAGLVSRIYVRVQNEVDWRASGGTGRRQKARSGGEGVIDALVLGCLRAPIKQQGVQG